MPLVRRRCRACTLPLGDPPHAALPVRCGRCGVAGSVSFAADGQPADFQPDLGPKRLLAWLAAARAAMSAGTPGMAVGACGTCSSALVLSSRQSVALACPHCGDLTNGTATELLVDQWTEPWARVAGGGGELEYRLAVVTDGDGTIAGCPSCGIPCDPADRGSRCGRCGAATWVERGGGRMQLAVRVDGTKDGRPYDAVIPIVQGERMLQSHAMRATGSNGSTLPAIGIGCAVATGVAIAAAAIGIAVSFSHC